MKRFFPVCLLLVAGGCTTKLIEVNPIYVNDNWDIKTLAILIPDRLDVRYSGNLEPEFGEGRQSALVDSFFRNQLVKDIEDNTNIRHCRIFDEEFPCSTHVEIIEQTNWYSFIPGTREIEIRVPDHGCEFSGRGYTAERTLILREIHIGTEFETHTTYYGTYTSGPAYSESKSLICEAKFVLWDNEKRRIISYGVARGESSGFFPVITMTNWKAVSLRFVRAIFDRGIPVRDFGGVP